VSTERGTFNCASVVVATGGLAVPQLGATPFGYRLAEQFGLRVVPPKPALVPLALPPDSRAGLAPLAGVAFAAEAFCAVPGTPRFRENVLITHRGISGPAVLQVSSYWQAQEYAGGPKRPVVIDLLPGIDASAWLDERRDSRALLANLLSESLPRRFAHEWCALHQWKTPVYQCPAAERRDMARALNAWTLMPSGTLGFAKAEVTLGGVDTGDLSSQTMEATAVPGLFFVGEVVDVTGWLGGYNFQWAWSSGWVAGQFV
jgi:predicted Rossmann fold flavoprotein